MRIGIIGGGVVGHATARTYIENNEVKVYDIDPMKGTGHTLHEVLSSDIVMVCLPTPQVEGGLACDSSIVVKFFEERAGGPFQDANYVLKSTVPIGTTKCLREVYGLHNLVHSPEFLTARCAVTDAMLPARNIIGIPYPGSHRQWSITEQGTRSGAEPLHTLYRERFPGIPIHCMTSDESEAVKLFQNSFFAVKIAYLNEINLLCQKKGLDWQTVLEGMLADGRIAHSHTKVPGPDGLYGFGGSCLPKDLANLITCMNECELHAHVCCATMARNDLIDRKRRKIT